LGEPSPTEDAKASSALFNNNGFYWGSRRVKFFIYTLRVLMIAVAPERLDFFIYTP